MENYLMDDYINSQKRNNGKNSSAESRRRRKAIDLFVNKHLGIKEIGLILEVSIKTVKEYLGETRLKNVAVELSREGMKADEIAKILEVKPAVVDEYLSESAIKSAKTSKDKEDKKPSSKISEPKQVTEQQKVTPRRVNNIVAQRDELIKQLDGEGLTISEVASKLNLTLDQAKERYSSLGLSIYTTQEIGKMRAEDRAKQEEEKKRKEREKRRIRDRERREKQKEKQREEQGEQQEPKKDESSDNKEEITSFDDLKRKMFELTKEGKSRKAADLARQYIKYGKFLKPKEIKKLSDMADFIDLMHSGEKRHKGKTGGEDKKEDELDR